MALTLGTILYVAILIINAMAVLSEDRFLVRSTCPGGGTLIRLTESLIDASQLAGHLHLPQRRQLGSHNPTQRHTTKQATQHNKTSA